MFNYCFSRLMRKTSQYGVVDDVAKNLHCINMYVSLRARASTHVKYKRAYHTRVRKHQLKEQMTNIYIFMFFSSVIYRYGTYCIYQRKCRRRKIHIWSLWWQVIKERATSAL